MNEELIQALMQSYGMDPQQAQMYARNAQAEMQLAPLQEELLKVNTFSRPSGHAGNILEGVIEGFRRPKVEGRHNEALMDALGSRYGLDRIQAQMEANQQQREQEELQGLYGQLPGMNPAEAGLRARGADVPKRPEQKDVRTSAIKNAEAMGLKPGSPEFNEYMRQATVSKAGTTFNIPAGYMPIDPSNPAAGVRPIPGSEAERETQEAARKGEQKSMNARAKYSGVLDEVEQAMGKVNNLTAGFIGSSASKIPGTEAYTLSRHLDTIKGNLGFDRLQQMREESKTGGALGQVSNIELNLLTSSLTALDAGLPPEQLQRNLQKVQSHYTNFLDALSGKMPQGYDETGNPVEAGSGQTVQVSTPQEAEQLPPGTRYITPDGQEYIR